MRTRLQYRLLVGILLVFDVQRKLSKSFTRLALLLHPFVEVMLVKIGLTTVNPSNKKRLKAIQIDKITPRPYASMKHPYAIDTTKPSRIALALEYAYK